MKMQLLCYFQMKKVMAPSKQWMKLINDRDSEIYKSAVKKFLNYAFRKTREEHEIRCPCNKCFNTTLGTRTTIETHLKVHGILQNYTFWFHHGERLGEPLSESESKDEHDAEVEECDSEDEVEELLRYLYPNIDGGLTHTNCVEEDPNLVAEQFYKLLSDVEMDDNSFEL
ncbi:hypothetical protein P3S68_009787 [Capsicum galapagoense]